MFKKMKGILSFVICVLTLCTAMTVTSYAAHNVASVSFDGNTAYYTTIDDAWAAAIAFDTTAENKATIKLLDNCSTENMLTNTDDYLVFDTNGKTLTGSSDLIMYQSATKYVIGINGGRFDIIGNGKISGASGGDFGKAIVFITGGTVYIDGPTIHNTGDEDGIVTGSTAVCVTGGELYFLDGYLLSKDEYALDTEDCNVYLYSGRIESTGRWAMTNSGWDVKVYICFSEKPLYLIDNKIENWAVIYERERVYLEDNISMDLEYSENPDGSNSTILKDVTSISAEADSDKNYLKIQTRKMHNVAVNATDGGTASISSPTVKTGESVTLTATPNAGYTFVGWYDGNTKLSDAAEYVAKNVTADKTYTARFAKEILYYTVSANVGTDGGTVSGGGKVPEGGSITLDATANDGYIFDGWYDGNEMVCATAEFVVRNVSADKTYTAKFIKNAVVEPEPEPSAFDFTSLRTLRTKNITVDHETKTIDIEAADDTNYITIFVHQKDVIPGGVFRMASYLGNKVVYDKNGSYRVYFVHNFTVPVKAKITVNGVSEQYTVNVKFDASKAKFDFTSLKGKGFSDVTVNHDSKTIHITADDSANDIILYVNQHDTVYGGKLRMASYLGNKVKYDASGVYTIYAVNKNKVSVKANITINGVVEQYLITIDFPAISWGFDNVKADNVKNVSIDHENKIITIDTIEGCDNILLYIDQICQSNVKGQIWMKSYMGNKVLYNSADRTYRITKKDKNSITVKTKITMLGETRYYDININFTENK